MRERAWAETKSREKPEIPKPTDMARKKTKFEASVRKNSHVVNRSVLEASAKIRASANIQGAKRDRAEADARAKAEAEIREKADNARNRVESKARKREKAYAVQRAAAEAPTKIRVQEDSKRSKIKRAEAEARQNAEDEIN